MDSTVCFVYWIHRPCDLDITKDGYVGITKDFNSRMKSHKRAARLHKGNHKLYNALNKYDDFLFEVIVKSTRDYCLDLEKKLRSSNNIGLNHSAGGKYTPSNKVIDRDLITKLRIASINAHKNNPELAENQRRMRLGAVATVETKSKISKSNKGRGIGWRNTLAKPHIWKNAFDMYTVYVSNQNITYYSLSKMFELKFYQSKSILDLLKTGWNPNTDIEFINYIKGN